MGQDVEAVSDEVPARVVAVSDEVQAGVEAARPGVRPADGAAREVLNAIVWRPTGGQAVHSVEEIGAALADPSARTWVDVEDAADETLAALASALGLHDLVAEDIVLRDQRPKIVVMDDTLHMVIFGLRFDGELSRAEVDVVLGRRFLMTSHPSTWRPLDALSGTGRTAGSLLGEGVDMALYGVIAPIVDACFPIVDRISDEIDELVEGVASGRSAELVERLFRVRRWLLELRHLVSPVREILDQLAERELSLVDPAHRLYFRDAWGQAVHLTEELDTQRELASGVLDAYLSSVNNDLAEVMRRLTAITAVLAGVGAAAGIFGMSEAASALGLPAPLGFWLVAAIVVAVGVLVFAYFRRIRWL